MNKTYTATEVLNMLESQSFKDWYESDLEDYVNDKAKAKMKHEILADIHQMLD